MGEAAKRIAAYADIEALPPNIVGEIIDGELHTMPRPTPRHGRVQLKLGTWSDSHFDAGNDGPTGWWILPEPEVHLGSDVLVPDLAGWRRSRLPQLPTDTHLSVVPDWVCEVLSPSTQGYDRARKMTRYAVHGVSWAWLVDPLAELLEVFKLTGSVWVRVAAHEGAEVVRVAPFEEAELSLSVLWGTR